MYFDPHARLFAEMLELTTRGRPVEFHLLRQKLQVAEALDAIREAAEDAGGLQLSGEWPEISSLAGMPSSNRRR